MHEHVLAFGNCPLPSSAGRNSNDGCGLNSIGGRLLHPVAKNSNDDIFTG